LEFLDSFSFARSTRVAAIGFISGMIGITTTLRKVSFYHDPALQ